MSNDNEPLGKPRGTVRAIIAIIVISIFSLAAAGGAILMLYIGRDEMAVFLFQALTIEAAAVTAYYFGSRPAGD